MKQGKMRRRWLKFSFLKYYFSNINKKTNIGLNY